MPGLVLTQKLQLENPYLMLMVVFMGMFQLDTFLLKVVSTGVGRVLLQVIC